LGRRANSAIPRQNLDRLPSNCVDLTIAKKATAIQFALTDLTGMPKTPAISDLEPAADRFASSPRATHFRRTVDCVPRARLKRPQPRAA
jgi:hypothetical protein